MGLFSSEPETQTSTSTQSTQVDLPDYIKEPLKDLISNAVSLGNQPFTPYDGERVAQLTDDELASFDIVRALTGQTSDLIQNSLGISQEVANRGLNGFTGNQIDQWMNPYVNDVIDATKRSMFENYDLEKRNMQQAAGETAAFGGSRYGLAQAQLSEDFQQNISDYENMARAQAYDKAISNAFAGTQLAGQAGIDYANLATLAQGADYTDIAGLQQAGGLQRGVEQAGLDAAYEEFLREQNFPYEQSNFLGNLLLNAGQLTAGSTTTGTQTNTVSGGGGSPFSQVLGMASLAAAPFTGGASMMGSMGSLFGGGISSAMASAGMAGINSAMSGYGLNQGVYNSAFPHGPSQGGLFKLNKGGKVGGLAAYNSGGDTLSNKTLNFMKFIQRLDEATDGDEDNGMGLPIYEDTPMYPDAPNSSEYLDMWEAIDRGELRPPVDRDTFRSGFSIDNPKDMNNYFDTLAFLESSNNPDAVNKHTGAAGLYQFMPKTADYYGLSNPHDPKQAREAVGRLTEDNIKILRKNLDRDPSMGEVYLAHQQGPTGASKLLNNWDKPAKDVVGLQQVLRNGGKEDMTAGEFANMWINKFENKLYGGDREALNFNDGGTATAFQEDLVKYIGIPSNRAVEKYTNFGLSGAEGLSNLMDYFTQPSGKDSETTSTIKKLKIDTGLSNAQNRLERAELPQGLAKMMQQIRPLADKGATDVRLNKEGNGLDVYGFNKTKTTKEETQVDPRQALMDLVSKSTGKQTDTVKEDQTKEKTTSKFNYPLAAFGAALLTSKGDFFEALGEGAKAGMTTSMTMKEREKEFAQQQLENTIKKRYLQMQEQQYQRALDKAPLDATLKQLEIAKMIKDLESDPKLMQRYSGILEKLIETNIGGAMTDDELRQRALILASDPTTTGGTPSSTKADPLGLR